MNGIVDAGTAIRPTLEAFKRGTKRSKLRVLVIVCAEGHTLLEVFPTSSGSVALWSSPEYGPRPRREDCRAAFVSADDLGEDVGEEDARVGCRCTDAATVRFDWVEEQLAAGARRA